MDFLTSPQFWVALGQIIIIDILLGGDNAVVIALACRKLPPAQRTKGIIWGTAGAIVLRVVLIMFAMTLLNVPFLKLVGALRGRQLAAGQRDHDRVVATQQDVDDDDLPQRNPERGMGQEIQIHIKPL